MCGQYIIIFSDGDLAMIKKIVFKIDPWRKQRGVLKPDAKPIPRGKYAKELFNEGAGWKNE